MIKTFQLFYSYRAMNKTFRLLILLFLLPVSNSYVSAQNSVNNLKRVYSETKKMYGFEDSNGNLVIPYKYFFVDDFVDNYAVVSNKNKYGIIDKQGEIKLALKYDFISCYNAETTVYMVFKGKYNETNPSLSNGKYGLLDKNLNELLPCENEEFRLQNQIIHVAKMTEEYKITTKNWGIVNLKGQIIVPFKSAVPSNFNNGLAVVYGGYDEKKINPKWGLINDNGEVLIPISYDKVEISGNIISCANVENRKFFLYTSNGKKIRTRGFDNWGRLTQNIIYFYEDNKRGLLKLTGKELEASYADFEYKENYNGLIIAMKDGKKGLLDTLNFNSVAPCIYDKITLNGNNDFLVQQVGKFGVISKKSQNILDCNLEKEPKYSEAGYYLFALNGKTGCVDKNGNIFVKPDLDESYVAKNYSVAGPNLVKLLTLFPNDDNIIYLTAFGKYKNSTSDEALEYLKKLISKYSSVLSTPKELFKVLSLIYLDKNMLKEAEANCRLSQDGTLFMKIGDAYFKNNNLPEAESCYKVATIYGYNNPTDAKQKQELTALEMKKRGINKEPTKKFTLTEEPTAADIPVGLNNFTINDKIEYLGNYSFNYLFTYNQAFKNCPVGFRLPTLNDWNNLLMHIVNSEKITGKKYYVVDYIGRGWNRSYYMKEGLKNTHYAFYSKDKYGLNISPLKMHLNESNSNEAYRDGITYWLQPGLVNGKEVNAISFSIDGYEFTREGETTKACIRYVKIK